METGRNMIKFTKIKETCLYINDLEKAFDFYHNRLKLEVLTYIENKHLFLKVGASVLLCFNPLDSKNKISPPGHFAEGNQHIAFEVPKSEYEKVKIEIENTGIPITHTETWENDYESFYFEDPERNVLEVIMEGMWG